jgi:hypothetical protein
MTIDDRRKAELQVKYPAWDVWYVRAVYGPTTWCVRPAGTQMATHHEHDPDDLDKWLAGQ